MLTLILASYASRTSLPSASSLSPRIWTAVGIVALLTVCSCGLALPLLALGFGVWELARQHRGGHQTSQARTVGAWLATTLGGATSALLAMALVLGALSGPPRATAQDTPPTSPPVPPATQRVTPRPTQPPPVTAPVVPDLAGASWPAASGILEALTDGRYDYVDGSPLGRSVLDHSNWTVIATLPAAGQPVPTRSDVTAVLLKNSEAQWFTAHARMPKLKVGRPVEDVLEDLGDISELVELRYPKAHTPPDERPRQLRDPKPPSLAMPEPASERARSTLVQAYGSYGSVVAKGASLPAAGASVRPGRIIVVLVREVHDEPTEDPGRSWVPPAGGGGGDDDFDFPDRLCPTRFC